MPLLLRMKPSVFIRTSSGPPSYTAAERRGEAAVYFSGENSNHCDSGRSRSSGKHQWLWRRVWQWRPIDRDKQTSAQALAKDPAGLFFVQRKRVRFANLLVARARPHMWTHMHKQAHTHVYTLIRACVCAGK